MKVLIAEDTKDMNRVLTVALEHEGYQVDSATDGVEATEFIQNNGYDCIILDIMMPRKDGIEVLKDLRKEHVTTPVIMLTAKAEIDDRVDGLDAGADDYLAKPFSMKELLARVRAMTRRQHLYGGEEQTTTTYADLMLDENTCELRCENSVRLSVREFELLQFMIQNELKVVDEKTILQKVWADSPEADESTLYLYIMYLRNKLSSISSCVQITGKMGRGYRLEATYE